MHVGLVCNEYPPAAHGGIGSITQDAAEGLVAAGYRVTVVGVYEAGVEGERVEEARNGARVVRLAASSRKIPHRARSYWDRWRLRQTLVREHRRDAFDLIGAPDYDGWLPWGGVPGVPGVNWLHGSNFYYDTELGRPGHTFEHGLERRSLLRADFWLGFSCHSFERTLRHCHAAAHRGSIIPHAVDTTVFSPGPEPVEPGLIVFVNSVNPRKGVGELIDAINLLFPSHPQARLVLIGSDHRVAGRSYADQLRERINPELRARVNFVGRLPRAEIVPWLRRATVCCYPSHAETFGLAPLEAMSSGRPTIYSRQGPGPEMIEDGVSGLLCDPLDPRDIAEKIAQVLDHPSLAERLGQAARQRVLEKFDRRDWITRHVDFYRQCVEEFKELKT